LNFLFDFYELKFILELFLKGSLIIAISLLMIQIFKNSSAKLKQTIMIICFVGLFVLPFFSFFKSGIELGIVHSVEKIKKEDIKNKKKIKTSTTINTNLKTLPSMNKVKLENQAGNEKKNDKSLLILKNFIKNFVFLLWLLGGFIVLFRLFIGLSKIIDITKEGSCIQRFYPWNKLIPFLVQKLKLKKKIELEKNKKIEIPVTWGFRKSFIIMPVESKNWSKNKCSTVLQHELSHVKKNDFIIRVFALIICAFNWFNPFVWFALKELKKQQEMACDDMLLETGVKASSYAKYLLSIKRKIDYKNPLPSTALCMACQSDLKTRISRILAKNNIYKETKMKSKIILVIIAVFLISLIGLTKPFNHSEENKKFYEADGAVVLDNKISNSKDSQKKEEKKKKKKAEKLPEPEKVSDKETNTANPQKPSDTKKPAKESKKKIKLIILKQNNEEKTAKKIGEFLIDPDNDKIKKISVKGNIIVLKTNGYTKTLKIDDDKISNGNYHLLVKDGDVKLVYTDKKHEKIIKISPNESVKIKGHVMVKKMEEEDIEYISEDDKERKIIVKKIEPSKKIIVKKGEPKKIIVKKLEPIQETDIEKDLEKELQELKEKEHALLIDEKQLSKVKKEKIKQELKKLAESLKKAEKNLQELQISMQEQGKELESKKLEEVEETRKKIEEKINFQKQELKMMMKNLKELEKELQEKEIKMRIKIKEELKERELEEKEREVFEKELRKERKEAEKELREEREKMEKEVEKDREKRVVLEEELRKERIKEDIELREQRKKMQKEIEKEIEETIKYDKNVVGRSFEMKIVSEETVTGEQRNYLKKLYKKIKKKMPEDFFLESDIKKNKQKFTIKCSEIKNQNDCEKAVELGNKLLKEIKEIIPEKNKIRKQILLEKK